MRIPLAAALLALAACRVESVIDSEPRGAVVEVDGQRGVTPFTASLAVTTFGSYPIRAEYEGYELYESTVEKQADLNTILATTPIFPFWLLDWNVPAPYVLVRMRPAKRFPRDSTREVPFEPILPPLPPGMDVEAGSATRPKSAKG